MTELGAKDPTSMVRWSVGGIFPEGLAARDFDRLSASLAPALHLRALLPPGPASWYGAEDLAETFRSWFGGATDFELVDATVGEVGGRLHLSWRLRVRPAPFGIGDGWHIIEQQAYADAGEVIEAIDLEGDGSEDDADRRRVAAEGQRVPSARSRRVNHAKVKPAAARR